MGAFRVCRSKGLGVQGTLPYTLPAPCVLTLAAAVRSLVGRAPAAWLPAPVVLCDVCDMAARSGSRGSLLGRDTGMGLVHVFVMHCCTYVLMHLSPISSFGCHVGQEARHAARQTTCTVAHPASTDFYPPHSRCNTDELRCCWIDPLNAEGQAATKPRQDKQRQDKLVKPHSTGHAHKPRHAHSIVQTAHAYDVASVWQSWLPSPALPRLSLEQVVTECEGALEDEGPPTEFKVPLCDRLATECCANERDDTPVVFASTRTAKVAGTCIDRDWRRLGIEAVPN